MAASRQSTTLLQERESMRLALEGRVVTHFDARLRSVARDSVGDDGVFAGQDIDEAQSLDADSSILFENPFDEVHATPSQKAAREHGRPSTPSPPSSTTAGAVAAAALAAVQGVDDGAPTPLTFPSAASSPTPTPLLESVRANANKWKEVHGEERMDALETRRQELLACEELKDDPQLRQEWASIVAERDRIFRHRQRAVHITSESDVLGSQRRDSDSVCAECHKPGHVSASWFSRSERLVPCDNCGGVVCHACAAHTYNLPSPNAKPPVCTSCFKRIELAAKARHCVRIRYTNKTETVFYLVELPASLWSTENIEQLHIDNTKLKVLPDGVGALDMLRVLDVSHNLLCVLPKTLGALSQLETLRASHNELLRVPSDICNITSLKLLDLSYNALSRPPRRLHLLTNLTHLDLSKNPGMEALKLKSLELPPSLTSLNLSHTNMNTAPVSLWSLLKLVSLDLSHNNLPVLSDGIGCLVALETCNLSHNALAALPDAIHRLCNLTSLNISHNQDIKLTPYLGCLNQLQSLNISNCKLAALPSTMAAMSRLNTLLCDHNELTAIPPCLLSMKGLRQLSLRRNPVTSDASLEGSWESAYTLVSSLNSQPTLPAPASSMPQLLDTTPTTLQVVVWDGNCGTTITRLVDALSGHIAVATSTPETAMASVNTLFDSYRTFSPESVSAPDLDDSEDDDDEASPNENGTPFLHCAILDPSTTPGDCLQHASPNAAVRGTRYHTKYIADGFEPDKEVWPENTRIQVLHIPSSQLPDTGVTEACARFHQGPRLHLICLDLAKPADVLQQEVLARVADLLAVFPDDTLQLVGVRPHTLKTVFAAQKQLVASHAAQHLIARIRHAISSELLNIPLIDGGADGSETLGPAVTHGLSRSNSNQVQGSAMSAPLQQVFSTRLAYWSEQRINLGRTCICISENDVREVRPVLRHALHEARRIKKSTMQSFLQKEKGHVQRIAAFTNCLAARPLHDWYTHSFSEVLTEIRQRQTQSTEITPGRLHWVKSTLSPNLRRSGRIKSRGDMSRSSLRHHSSRRSTPNTTPTATPTGKQRLTPRASLVGTGTVSSPLKGGADLAGESGTDLTVATAVSTPPPPPTPTLTPTAGTPMLTQSDAHLLDMACTLTDQAVFLMDTGRLFSPQLLYHVLNAFATFRIAMVRQLVVSKPEYVKIAGWTGRKLAAPLRQFSRSGVLNMPLLGAVVKAYACTSMASLNASKARASQRLLVEIEAQLQLQETLFELGDQDIFTILKYARAAVPYRVVDVTQTKPMLIPSRAETEPTQQQLSPTTQVLVLAKAPSQPTPDALALWQAMGTANQKVSRSKTRHSHHSHSMSGRVLLVDSIPSSLLPQLCCLCVRRYKSVHYWKKGMLLVPNGFEQTRVCVLVTVGSSSSGVIQQAISMVAILVTPSSFAEVNTDNALVAALLPVAACVEQLLVTAYKGLLWSTLAACPSCLRSQHLSLINPPSVRDYAMFPLVALSAAPYTKCHACHRHSSTNLMLLNFVQHDDLVDQRSAKHIQSARDALRGLGDIVIVSAELSSNIVSTDALVCEPREERSASFSASGESDPTTPSAQPELGTEDGESETESATPSAASISSQGDSATASAASTSRCSTSNNALGPINEDWVVIDVARQRVPRSALAPTHSVGSLGSVRLEFES
eukprot:m.261213 g.261213  ORF g.261213 m.261213 type:complete len:1661 (+) comp15576_c0_seq1:212-5194(+)